MREMGSRRSEGEGSEIGWRVREREREKESERKNFN